MPSSQTPQTSPRSVWLQQLLQQRVAQAANHLIQQSQQAQRRLAPHAGKFVRLHAAGVEWTLGVTQEGGLESVRPHSVAASAALELGIDTAEVLAAQWRGERIGLSGVRIKGDADFAQAMSWLLGNLRWDAEDDLARWFGDIAAHRMARIARHVANRGAGWRAQFETDVRDWLAEAPRDLVGRREFADCSAAVAQLRDVTARLDKRIQLLARRCGTVRS